MKLSGKSDNFCTANPYLYYIENAPFSQGRRVYFFEYIAPQFSQPSGQGKNRARTNFSPALTAEGAPIYEQRELRSSGERASATLRMGAG